MARPSIEVGAKILVMEDIEPAALAAALNEIPLFREIQRVLSAQHGPVNWEIASQVGVAIAGVGEESDVRVDERELEEACRLAELKVLEKVDFVSSAGLVEPRAVSAREAARFAQEALEGPLASLATGLRQGMGTAALGPLAMLVDAVGPLLFGLQTGFLVGALARQIHGHYDLRLPAPSGRLFFVLPNIARTTEELGVDRRQMLVWVAMHEITHHAHFEGLGWPKSHLTTLMRNYTLNAAIDPEEIANKMRSVGETADLESLLSRPEDLLPLLSNPAQEQTAAEIRAFLAVLEGHVDLAVQSASEGLIPEAARIREGMIRRSAERSQAERLLERMLAIDLRPEDHRRGERFVRKVAEAGQLGKLFEGPGSLPKSEELDDPAGWLNRVAFA